MTSIEDLSNEIFYEFFEYLDGCEIYEAFSNLNIRFQNLLTYSFQPLKIDLCTKSESMLQYYCKQVIIPNKNRIISLRLSSISTMEFFELIPINLSLSRLESLILNEINSNLILPFLRRLMSLPRLFSLTLQFDDNLGVLKIVYQWLFCLPVLKYCKITSKSLGKYWPLWSTNNDKYISSIEHLIIDHDCTINGILNILSCTPRLCYLTCKSFRTSYRKKRNISINLPNLKYISIDNCDECFDEFEIFFKEIHSRTQVLRFKTSQNMDYVDANRWERLISHHMPHLHTFYLQYSIIFNDEFRFVREHKKSNGFTSSFWIERQWIFEFKVNVNKTRCIEMIYSIHPYRKDYSSRFTDQNSEQLILNANQRKIENPSIYLSQSVELVLTGSCSDEEYQSFISNNSYLFKKMQINRLNIDNYTPSIGLLIKLLYILPNVNALRISSFSMNRSQTICFKETRDYNFVLNNNNIRKVCLGQMDEFEVHNFVFMPLWRHVEHLEITCKKEVNIEMVIKIILKKYTKYIPHLGSICLCISKINDKMVEQLQMVIDLQKLLDNYMIKHANNKLYLRWK